MNDLKNILVYCGSSSGFDSAHTKTAIALGQTIGDRKANLIYGGAKIGLMGSVADGALSRGAKVIGIIPHFLKTIEVAHENLSELIIVQNMHERKRKMFEMCDSVIALPGGFGTMEELFEMLTWAQFGLHDKPIGILNISGFYVGLKGQIQRMVDGGFLKEVNVDMLLMANAVPDLLKLMEEYHAATDAKWLDDDVKPF